MSKHLLIGNWKMNLLPEDASKLISQYVSLTKNSNRTQVGIAPTFLAMSAVIAECNSSDLWIGGQNAHQENDGAFTGEVSASMLQAIGCAFSLTGHSECRHVLGESQDLITKRSSGVLDNQLKLVYCFGETLAEKEAGNRSKVLQDQLLPIMELINEKNHNQLILAYEPVWAIGTGKVATIQDIKDSVLEINEIIKNTKPFCNAAILYGGSVKPDNYQQILAVQGVSGALVGGASLKYEQFLELYKISENC